MIKKILKNALIFLVAVFFILYFCIQVKNIFIDSMQTEYATLATIDDTIQMKCWIVRDETILFSDKNGTYNYVVSEGEKLALDQTVANYYNTDKEFRIQEEISEINQKISILEDSSVERNYFTLNVSKIDRDLVDVFVKYKKSISSGDFSLASQNREDIITTLNKRYLVVNAKTSFEETIEKYKDRKNLLVSNMQGNDGSISSVAAGYFFSDIDGYETLLTPELIENGDFDEIITAINSEPTSQANKAVGKIISEFEWYTVCLVDKESAQRFSSGVYYEISYPYSVGKTVKSVLDKKIVKSNSDEVILVFQSAANIDSFNFMRNQKVEVKLNSYSGLRIKKEALRIVDGEEGVYVLNGNTVEFKRASKLYENDGYYIISVNDPKSDEKLSAGYLKMYDAVINSGKDLYHGKIIG